MNGGMKREDMKPCVGCGKGLMHGNNPIVYEVTVSQHFMDLGAIRRQAGLEMMMGDPGIASVMSPISSYSQPVSTNKRFICQDCFLTNMLLIDVWEGKEPDPVEEEVSNA